MMLKKFLLGGIVVSIIVGCGLRRWKGNDIDDYYKSKGYIPTGKQCTEDWQCQPHCPKRQLYKNLGLPALECPHNNMFCERGQCVKDPYVNIAS